jgi:hypothetical protein
VPSETFLSVLDDSKLKIRIPSGSEEWEQEYVEARELGREMLDNYIRHYGRDDHKHYVATEQTGSVWLPDLLGRRRQIKYWYTFDGVYRDLRDGLHYLDEHKTAKAISVDHLPLDQQTGSYWAVANNKLRRMGVLKDGESIAGITYNFLRKAMADLRPRNPDGAYTNKPRKEHYHACFEAAGVPKALWSRRNLEDLAKLAYHEGVTVYGEVSSIQPKPLFERHTVFRTPEERASQFRRIREDAWHIDQARNNPNYPIVKNVQTAGALACPGCPFFRMCELHEQGDMQSVEEFKKAMYTVRDPYAAYRKSA